MAWVGVDPSSIGRATYVPEHRCGVYDLLVRSFSPGTFHSGRRRDRTAAPGQASVGQGEPPLRAVVDEQASFENVAAEERLDAETSLQLSRYHLQRVEHERRLT